MPNATHRKRLARAYAAHAGIPYMAALNKVTEAATAGRLPSRLDDAGMLAALRILDTGTTATPVVIAAALAAATNTGTTALPRKTASDPRDQQIYDLSAIYELLTGKQGLMYISSPGSGKDRYVFGGVGGGHVCHGRDEALNHITTLLHTASTDIDTTDRIPYVGTGADGARRSAQIDREEADGLDQTDPRRQELLTSAFRWDLQAARHGSPLTPQPHTVCPVCGAPVSADATRWRCENGHEVPDGLGLHLENSSLLRLREVWQGRVTRELAGRNRDYARFHIDNKPASDLKDLELMWLADHDYITATLPSNEEWVVARTTTFGDTVLAYHGADTDKFHDGLPRNPRPATTSSDPATPDSSPAGSAQSGPSIRTLRSSHINACPIKALSPDHYRADGGCRCYPDPTIVHGFTPEGSMTATVRDLLKVRDRFLEAGRLEWWWHLGPFTGSHGFKVVEGIDEADGSLILRDENPDWMEPRTTLSLDYIDDPDKAARHLIWADHAGLTLRDKITNEADASYRIVGPAEPAQVRAEPKKVTSGKTRKTIRELDPLTERLMGGPHATKVYDQRNRRVNATCDVCNRRLATGEGWWMVHSFDRNWESNAGVVCADHDPASLPLWNNDEPDTIWVTDKADAQRLEATGSWVADPSDEANTEFRLRHVQ